MPDEFSPQLAMIGEGCTADGSSLVVCSNGSYAPLSRRFWSAGDYEVQPNTQPTSHSMLLFNGLISSQTYIGPDGILCLYQGDSGNRLQVHPKFLHSNATSHKWVFGGVYPLFASDHYGFTFSKFY